MTALGLLAVAWPLLAGPASPASAHIPRPPRDSVLTSIQMVLDSFRVATKVPGVTFGIAFPDGSTAALASGLSDTAARRPMRPSDRLLQGSVGKTYVAAVALQLVAEGKLDLEARIERYLGKEPWFSRLPNAAAITVRQLMNHTSGLVRYEFNPAATKVLREQPFKVWTPEERLAFLFDQPAPFEAGAGWDYSDTNYIVLGMIIERLTGRSYYEELDRRILGPHRLRHTIPSDRPELPGVVTGYAGPGNELGGYDASIVRGKLAVNPQFEWTGGGIASTAEDLARWGKLLFEGKAVPPEQLAAALEGVPAKLGPNTRYGLGVIIRDTPLGPGWGHSGFFPGYATEMIYFPDLKVAVAVQANGTNPYPRGMAALLIRAAGLAGGAAADPAGRNEEPAVLAVIERMFRAMRTRDTAAVRAVFEPGARLVGMRTRPDGSVTMQTITVDQWVQVIGRDSRGPWIERAFDPQVRVSGTLASVWADYDFHFGAEPSHCGVDAVHLLRFPDGWRIVSLADTFVREGCPRRDPPGP